MEFSCYLSIVQSQICSTAKFSGNCNNNSQLCRAGSACILIMLRSYLCCLEHSYVKYPGLYIWLWTTMINLFFSFGIHPPRSRDTLFFVAWWRECIFLALSPIVVLDVLLLFLTAKSVSILTSQLTEDILVWFLVISLSSWASLMVVLSPGLYLTCLSITQCFIKTSILPFYWTTS